MVAYTDPDCLPYFECTDDPCLNTGTVCEPSTVSCDLAQALDARLLAYDAVIARTAVAVPFFKVARTATQLVDANLAGFDAQIHWDTVLADNDGLVDLDQDDTVAYIQRPGLWWFQLYLKGLPPQTVGNLLYGNINNGTSSFSYSQMIAQYRSGSTYVRVDHSLEETAAFLALVPLDPIGASVGFAGTTGTGIITVEYAELTGYWYGEEVP